MADALAKAWEAWHTAGDEVRAAIEATDRFRDHPEYRAGAMSSLLEAQAMAYNFAVAPRRRMEQPRYFPHTAWHDHIYALGQPIQDFKYGALFLDGRRTYRLRGNVGATKLFLLQVHNRLQGHPDSVEIGNYDFQDVFEIADDGSFDIVVSAQEHEGNWIKLDETSPKNYMLIRRIVGDWADDLGAITIDAQDEGDSETYVEDQAITADAVQDAAGFLKYLVNMFTIGLYDIYIDRADGKKNSAATMPGAEVASGLVGSRSTTYVPGVYKIAADEALLVEWDAPDSAYWSFQVGDVWSRPLDYLNHQVDLNMERAAIDPDGKVRVVIALDDPGIANWLDPQGNTEGTIVTRNYRCAHPTQTPEMRVVKVADLADILPAETTRVTPEERRKALEHRRQAAGARLQW